MKLIRKALIGAAALATVATPTLAAADSAAALSLSRAATSGGDESELDGPKIPYIIGVGLVVTALAVTVVLATEEPDSP
ncbi:hypothetical protein [Sphingomonas sp. M1-B02]|uniref:hypothetical protein n=1 Tax=Sphingomonas sp. M1-B02 TaxID=3114300 RepID=UPI00223F2670|nr:hypothetical protein [Sphingomonas sp. S6-11]UZK65758.1 hypothetical protein OKW87_14780 [Sphingomonas sp. S6-11]